MSRTIAMRPRESAGSIQSSDSNVTDDKTGSDSEVESNESSNEDEQPRDEKGNQVDQDDLPKEEPYSPVSFPNVFPLIIVLISVLLVVVCNWPLEMKDRNKAGMPIDYSCINIYEEGLQNLKVNFTSQTPRFWKLLKHRGLAHLRNRSPSQPLVFLLAAAPNAHDIVDCFATKLAGLLDPENADDLAKIVGQDHRGNQGDTTKKKLDQILCDTFGKGKKAALVYQLNLLPPPSPMMFHSYCDDQNAQYKRVALIFTVHLPRNPEPTLSPVEAEGTVEKYLSEEVWVDSPYDKDKIAALLSRIADTVLLVSPERSPTLKDLCAE